MSTRFPVENLIYNVLQEINCSILKFFHKNTIIMYITYIIYLPTIFIHNKDYEKLIIGIAIIFLKT